MAKNTTIEDDAIDLGDAEDFKLPGDGVHNAFLQSAEFGPNKAGNREQFQLVVVLSEDDPDAPNLPMRYYLGWPHPEDKDIMWGTRTAYGSKIKSIKDALTAFGGQESGPINKDRLATFFDSNLGSAVKVRLKSSKREDTGEMQSNVQALLPA